VVCTSNNISTLPAAFTRAERFDAVYYVDFPGVVQKRTIWQMYLEKYKLDRHQPKPVDAEWSGAEIRACCRLAAMLDVPLLEAAQNVVPVARTAREVVLSLRKWAAGRCLSADQPGIYKPSAESITVKPGRKVRHDASMN
jgi:SpoVK/Ycf46/Vps4 family AAA+-type ATPase